MKTAGSLATLALGLLLGRVEAVPAPQATVDPKCSRNNCMRAVIAGSFPDRPTVADCSSFLRKTVTPAVYTETVWATITPTTETTTSLTTEVPTAYETITVFETVDVATQTVTTTITQGAVPGKRDVVDDVIAEFDAEGNPKVNEKRRVTVHPSAIPTYATACSSVQAYSSACSCIGVTPTTITVATPTTVVTSTSTATGHATQEVTITITTTLPVTATQTVEHTATATATATHYAIPPQFNVRVVGPSNINGQLAKNQAPYGADRGNIMSFPGTSGTAVTYTLDSQGHLVELPSGNAASVPLSQPSGSHYFVYVMSDATRAAYQYAKVTCAISPVDLQITCSYGNSKQFGVLSSTYLSLATSSNWGSSTDVKVYAVPV